MGNGMRAFADAQDAEIAKLRDRIRDLETQLAEAKFRPMGDNHHNALLCPYCNPDRIDPAAERARALAAEQERDALRKRVEGLEGIAVVVRKMKARCDRIGDRPHWYSADADDLTELFAALRRQAHE